MRSMAGTMSRQRQGTEEAREHSEGFVARAIEQQAARIPSDWFLWGALGAMGASLFLQCSGRKEESNFIGQWAPSLLILGLYNKIVKVAGSDRAEDRRA